MFAYVSSVRSQLHGQTLIAVTRRDTNFSSISAMHPANYKRHERANKRIVAQWPTTVGKRGERGSKNPLKTLHENFRGTFPFENRRVFCSGA